MRPDTEGDMCPGDGSCPGNPWEGHTPGSRRLFSPCDGALHFPLSAHLRALIFLPRPRAVVVVKGVSKNK